MDHKHKSNIMNWVVLFLFVIIIALFYLNQTQTSETECEICEECEECSCDDCPLKEVVTEVYRYVCPDGSTVNTESDCIDEPELEPEPEPEQEVAQEEKPAKAEKK